MALCVTWLESMRGGWVTQGLVLRSSWVIFGCKVRIITFISWCWKQKPFCVLFLSQIEAIIIILIGNIDSASNSKKAKVMSAK